MRIDKPIPTHTAPAIPHTPEQKRLYEACQQLESTFLLQLWRTMQRTIPQSSKTLNYAEMFDFQFAEYLAMRGNFGLADQLYQQLSAHLPDSESEP